MNNSQFRRLINDTPGTAPSNDKTAGGQTRPGPGVTPTALGSRMRANIPMTPRSVASNTGIDFARQLAERNASLNPNSVKKFRSSAAPKGTKLGSGYQDRTQLRTSAEEDEKASRVKALEDLVKLGQMERSTFEALRDEIVGGHVKDVHLVKGLDWKLLERVRRGEDVLSDAAKYSPAEEVTTSDNKSTPSAEDVDDELEKLEEQEYQAKERQETIKKGEMAPPPPVAGKKRTRDEILKDLKASRQPILHKAQETRHEALGPKFHKVENRRATSRIEIDEKGREVLIVVDADGSVKRKVKKPKLGAVTNTNQLLMPDKDVKPLGLDVTVPSIPAVPEEQDDGDIFADVEGDYDPLGGELNDDEISDESDIDDKPSSKTNKTSTGDSPTAPNTATPLPKPPPAGPRNYFNEPISSTTDLSAESKPPGFQDPTILAALKKASTLDPFSEGDKTPSEEQAKAARHKKMLEAHDRDAEDMDMGFGSSRFEDEAEDAGEGKKVKLSVWGGDKGGEREGGGEGKEKRKRGPKKGKKGDKDSVKDVMSVMDRRKGEGKR
ncbi:MAG: hypothetical protein Q9168_000533 [Polycauliona sp. 1 TL-2023]